MVPKKKKKNEIYSSTGAKPRCKSVILVMAGNIKRDSSLALLVSLMVNGEYAESKRGRKMEM